MAILPNRGEIWLADLDPIRGHEQGGARPVLVLSSNSFNHSRAQLLFVAPLTRTNRNIPFHVLIQPPEGGVKSPSYILCDATRSISRSRLGPAPWGRVSGATLAIVEDRLRILFDL